MWRASFSTRHFDFEAYGPTRDDARRALTVGLVEHGHQYELEPGWFGHYGWPQDVAYTECKPMACYRDGSAIARVT